MKVQQLRGLGSAVAVALLVVHVEVQLKVHHLSIKLYESVWVVVHRTWRVKRGMRSESRPSEASVGVQYFEDSRLQAFGRTESQGATLNVQDQTPINEYRRA